MNDSQKVNKKRYLIFMLSSVFFMLLLHISVVLIFVKYSFIICFSLFFFSSFLYGYLSNFISKDSLFYTLKSNPDYKEYYWELYPFGALGASHGSKKRYFKKRNVNDPIILDALKDYNFQQLAMTGFIITQLFFIVILHLLRSKG